MNDDVPATMHAAQGVGLALDIIAAPMALEVMHHLFHGGRIADVESENSPADLAQAVAQLSELGVVDYCDGGTRLREAGQQLWRAYEQVALRRARQQRA
jgi:hypothetical protein